MLLAVDIGNTNVVAGLLDGDLVARVVRLATVRDEAPEAAGRRLLEALSADERARVRAAVVASVIVPLGPIWADALAQALGVAALLVDHRTDTGVRLAVEHPEQVGVDRYVNLAALAHLGVGVLVVDCGTATTFDVLSPNGEFLGGTIAPGMAISAEALASRAPRLPPVPLSAPPRAIATNTLEAIRSGVAFGYAGLVEGLIARMRAEAGFPLRVYATGGLAATLAPLCPSFEVVDPHLTLRGLAAIHARAYASRT
jgi:type III pantothenate kinase